MSVSALPTMMPAAVYLGDGVVEAQELPVPELQDGGAIVEVSHCGICGTDLHFVLEGMGRKGAVFGHEWSGTLVALGPDARTDVPMGTTVVAADRPGCGRCRSCRAGRPSVCSERAAPNFFGGTGAFARYKHVDASSLLPLPAGVSLRDAALTEPLAVAMHAHTLSGARPDDRVLVTGAGPVGTLMIAVLRAAGIDDITVSEPAPLRRERAAALGARVVSPDSLSRAPMGRPVDEAFTLAFECSGRAVAAEAALDQLDRAGTFLFLGTGSDAPRVNHNRVIILEQTIMGSYNYDDHGFAKALDLIASGKLPLDLLIEPEDFPLDQVGTTMQRLGAGELASKALVVPRIGG
ncbi:MAG TPA: alcohol dehydrogenase catalytic domain-containing protein [Acidimicrobiia bacterium]|nr:alcohol dehydrogenase catalytic domain-containing protein [Acidimicrobiia bacterium]